MREDRPWGSFTLLLDVPGCKVKTISVEPGRRLSYQSHSFRDERWTVVEGTAEVVIDGRRMTLGKGGTVSVDRGHRHRLGNPGPYPLMIVEVQLGERLSEDDIVRYEDDFGREDAAPSKGPGKGSVKGEGISPGVV